jgi:hypothetical protein
MRSLLIIFFYLKWEVEGNEKILDAREREP